MFAPTEVVVMTIAFEELGLTQYEAKAYESLVKFGKTTAAKISADSGVPYSRIYDILASLVRRGLVKVLPGKTKEYVATDPKELLKLVNKKREVLNKAASDIENLKKLYEFAVKEPVLLAYGKRNFNTLLKEIKDPKKYTYTMRYAVETKPEWIRSDKAKIKRGIDFKNLARYDEETKKNLKVWVRETGPTWRAFENEGVAMSIRDDEEILIALIKSNVTMLIRDAPFTKIMRQLFLAAWEKAPEIKKE
jgi:sugar-specific transcriptional regulator TrmB